VRAEFTGRVSFADAEFVDVDSDPSRLAKIQVLRLWTASSATFWAAPHASCCHDPVSGFV
jgi:hypothetical protein